MSIPMIINSNYQALLILYLMAVVYLVNRQLKKVVEGVDSVIVTDKSGKTIIKCVDEVVNNDLEVLM